jgi:predicted ferric reductase
LVGIAVLAMAYVYVLRPWLQRSHPYRLVAVERVAQGGWEVMLEPVDGEAIEFEPGQFAWLTVNRSSFSVTEHPFSMSSCPVHRPRVVWALPP